MDEIEAGAVEPVLLFTIFDKHSGIYWHPLRLNGG